MHLHHDHHTHGAHAHEHDHTHTHEHTHDGVAHSHPHAHAHEHDHVHPHEHDHLHGEGHTHDHSHEHCHDHGHEHCHDHSHDCGGECGSCHSHCEHTPMEELTALMKYMVGHNTAHANELAALAKQLQQAGVTSLQATYHYWQQGGAEGKLTTGLGAESALGGKRGLNQFLQYCQQADLPVYLELNLTDMRRSQLGFFKTYAAAQSVRSEPVIAYDYYLSTFQQKTDGRPLYLLSPANIPSAVDKVLSNLEKWSVTGYNAGTLANKIYSDMGQRSIDRGAAEGIMTAALSRLAAESKLQLSKANAYAFPYADTITDVPLYTSGYLIETYSVPFYSMVMHGVAYMSSGDINGYLSPEQALLRALEAGVGLKYAFGADNVAELSDTAISEYGYIEADRWLAHAAEQYQKLNQFLSAVSDQTMTAHTLISKDVRYSEFSNGMGVYVNYSGQDVTYGDLVIPAGGYVLQLSEEGA